MLLGSNSSWGLPCLFLSLSRRKEKRQKGRPVTPTMCPRNRARRKRETGAGFPGHGVWCYSSLKGFFFLPSCFSLKKRGRKKPFNGSSYLFKPVDSSCRIQSLATWSPQRLRRDMTMKVNRRQSLMKERNSSIKVCASAVNDLHRETDIGA